MYRLRSPLKPESEKPQELGPIMTTAQVRQQRKEFPSVNAHISSYAPSANKILVNGFAKSPLGRLPPELRLEIYSYVFETGKRYILRGNQVNFNLHQGTDVRALLRTCRFVRKEAFPSFFGAHTFIFQPIGYPEKVTSLTLPACGLYATQLTHNLATSLTSVIIRDHNPRELTLRSFVKILALNDKYPQWNLKYEYFELSYWRRWKNDLRLSRPLPGWAPEQRTQMDLKDPRKALEERMESWGWPTEPDRGAGTLLHLWALVAQAQWRKV